MSKPFFVGLPKFVAPAGIAVALVACTAVSALAAPLPRTGKVLKMTNGDLMCYLEVKDSQGKIHNVGADFEICQKTQFLNRRVRFTYKKVAINDCESAEPCGKTRMETIVVRLQPLGR
jgi:outer membrane protein W